ncbi:microtubule nucleation factor SSNA1-like [Ciona intestinalis]
MNFPSPNPGATVLQSYNNEMVKCIEDLCSKRDDLRRQIDSDQEEKAKLHNDIRILTNRLAKVNEDIAKKMTSQIEFDQAICETQTAYARVMETSQTLLQTVHSAGNKLKAKEAALSGSELKLPIPGPKRN